MAIREYQRACKQAGCGEMFTISAPSMDEDRAIGFSEPEYCPKHRALHAKSYSRIACHHFEAELTTIGDELVRSVEGQRESNGSAESGVFDPWTMPGLGYGPGGLGRFQRPPRIFEESNDHQPVERQFAIAQKTDELLAALEDHQVVILVGTTGSGKSTYVPWYLLTGGIPGSLSKWARQGPICVTQPRIQATRQVPRFIANSLNGTSLGVGAQIGFSHSNADEFDRRTRLLFMTDGKLINDIVSGAIGNYSIVMIDEAHERSANIDVILGLLRDQLYLYPHLRLIVASATIDFEAFLGYFYPKLKDSLATVNLDDFDYFAHDRRIPFVYSTARRFPIMRHFWDQPPESDSASTSIADSGIGVTDPLPEWWQSVNGGEVPTRDQLPNAIADLVKLLCEYLDAPSTPRENEGHILVFLPGSREIDQTVSIVNALGLTNVVSLPLYSQRPLDEQDAALNPSKKDHPKVFGKRRVVVSTNVAETSLTVEGVKYVIDSGYVKESYWNPKQEISELLTVRHSKAGCRQRWGRGGRVSPGHAFMLYTKQEFDDTFPEESTPSIARTSMEQVLLTAKAAGVRSSPDPRKVLAFDWMPLSRQEDRDRFTQELERAYESLHRRKAIDESGDLTKYGLELRGMPAALDVARIYTEGERYAMGVEVATLLPFLRLDQGLQALLSWDRDWDTSTKLRIRQSHQDLVFGCRDDLDLYLKLWVLWEAQPDKDRAAWAELNGVNYSGFQERIEQERQKLLTRSMDLRKAERRSVAVGKLNALRALIASAIPNDIYSVENYNSIPDQSLQSRRSSGEPLSWESYWDDLGQFQEYDDDVELEDGFGSPTLSQSEVLRRLSATPDSTDESALIEIHPTSVCAGRLDLDLVVACQRRANFRRPARAKALGMNLIRIDRSWLIDDHTSEVERALLYADLSRRQSAESVRNAEIRLFLPWLAPRNSVVRGVVENWVGDSIAVVDCTITVPASFPLAHLRGESVAVKGCLPITECDGNQLPGTGTEINLSVVTYEWTNTSVDSPRLGVKPLKSTTSGVPRRQDSLRKGQSVTVRMDQVLDDPLGRSPVFIVREQRTGQSFAMADTDFSGNTHPQGYFGRRFDIDEEFEVDVVASAMTNEVTLSRAKRLLREYAQLPVMDQIVDTVVVRVDDTGAYLRVSGSGYIGFVRRPLWPAGITLAPSDAVPARLRRFDRQVNVSELERMLDLGDLLPAEADLGIELDLRIPRAFSQFIRHNPLGSRLSVTIEKPLSDGGLLVAIDDVLKARIYDSELGFDGEGRLNLAREYSPGQIATVRIVDLKAETATIRCSICRAIELPGTIPEVLAAKVVKIRTDRVDRDIKHIICSWQAARDRWHQVYTRVDSQPSGPVVEIGDVVDMRLSRVDKRVSSIRASIMGVHAGSGWDDSETI